jgi:NTE family protein
VTRSRRIGLVLSGGGARGAYEAGVLSYLFEKVLPGLPPGTDFDVISGTSVGAIHGAYTAASAELPAELRATRLAATWQEMRLADVVRFSAADLLGVPFRALGLSRRFRRPRRGEGAEVLGGLVDVSPLERIVTERIPWGGLSGNLGRGSGRALCVSCTEVRTGRCTVFLDGPLADVAPWEFDPNARAIRADIGPAHVRASAAIPFLFPAVRVGASFYVDGGLRMNTPLSPALRLACDRILVIPLKHVPVLGAPDRVYPEQAITQPAFLLGKVLDAIMLDQLEVELQRLGLVNAILATGASAFGGDFLPRINEAVRAERGIGYRHVATAVVRPSADLGKLAADCYRRGSKDRALGGLPALLSRAALRGVPYEEADLLSYLLFDRCFTAELVALGRADAQRHEGAVQALFAD